MQDVRLYVALCLSEVLRIFAPEEPYDNEETLKSIYSSFLGAMRHLADPGKEAFQPAHALLQNVAAIGLLVPILDLTCPGADGLLSELFECLFESVNPTNSSLVEEDVTKVLGTMLEEAEDVSPEVLGVILERMVQPARGENSAAYNLACNLVRKSENNLQLAVQHFLIDALSNRGAGEHPLSRRYADILEAVAIVDSTSLVTVWPTIMEELQNDDAEPRARAVKLFGRILAAPGSAVAKDFTHYLSQFLRRFGDKDAEIRAEMCRWSGAFLAGGAMRGAATAADICGYLSERLLDYEEKVRLVAVAAACDIAEAVPRLVDAELLQAVGDRILDKKAAVRQLVLKRLSTAYRSYVVRFAEAETPQEESQRFDWIPSTLLKGCAQPDIRHHVVEPILVDLFPQRVSQERRSLFWLQALCKMDEHAAKAFNFMLRTKQSAQADVRAYLGLRQKCREARQSKVDEEESPSGVDEDEFPRAFAAVARHFPDVQKAAGHAEKLHALKDGNIFRGLATLLKPETTAAESATISQDVLKRIGSKHPSYEWTKLLLVKIAQQPFGREHVCKVLDVVTGAAKDKQGGSLTSALDHLVQMAHSAPHAFHGTANELWGLVSHRDDAVVLAACRICADAANCLDGPGVKKANICERLKVLCVEGTRAQAKHATRALSKLAASGGVGKDHLRRVFESIVEAAADDELLDSNLPAALATVQVIGQTAPALYHERIADVEAFVVEHLLARPLPKHKSRSAGSVSAVAEMQARSLKVLASGCAKRGEHVKRVLDVFAGVLARDESQGIGSGADLAHLRVGAAKAALIAARANHPSVSSRLFVAVSLAVEETPETLVDKVRVGITKHGLNHAYAAALALVAGCGKGEAKSEAKEALASVIAHVRRRAAAVKAAAVARANQDAAALSRSLLTHAPEYVLPYLVHLLAHHPELPSKEDGEVDCGAAYRKFQFTASAAVAALTAGTAGESVPAAFKILRRLKFTQDATDADASHGMYVLTDILLLVLHKEATRRGWDTGPFPGQVAFPRAFFNLVQKPAANPSAEEGGRARVGDYSHLPAGFEVKAVRHGAESHPRVRTAGARAPKKHTAARALKPAAEPTRLMPSRAARKAAVVDDDDDEYDDEEEMLPVPLGNEMVTPGVAKLVSYGIRNEVPVLELPAPPDFAAAEHSPEEEYEDDELTDDEEAPTVKKKPLADRRNKESETVSPGGKRALDKRMEAHTKENAVGVSGPTRASKQPRR